MWRCSGMSSAVGRYVGTRAGADGGPVKFLQFSGEVQILRAGDEREDLRSHARDSKHDAMLAACSMRSLREAWRAGGLEQQIRRAGDAGTRHVHDAASMASTRVARTREWF